MPTSSSIAPVQLDMLRRKLPVNWQRWDTRTSATMLRESLTGSKQVYQPRANTSISYSFKSTGKIIEKADCQCRLPFAVPRQFRLRYSVDWRQDFFRTLVTRNFETLSQCCAKLLYLALSRIGFRRACHAITRHQLIATRQL